MATEITLLEIDAPNAQFNAPFSGRGGHTARGRSGPTEDEPGPDDSASGGGSPARILPLLVLVGILVLAVVLRVIREETEAGRESDVDRP